MVQMGLTEICFDIGYVRIMHWTSLGENWMKSNVGGENGLDASTCK